MKKQKYKGIFNWHNELIVLWTRAHSERGAKSQFMVQLQQKLNRTPESVRAYFIKGRKANYEIKPIAE